MMKIDIEDRNARRTRIAKGLRGDCRIVEEAIAAIHVVMGMVAGRAAQCESGAFAFGHEFLRGERGGG